MIEASSTMTRKEHQNLRPLKHYEQLSSFFWNS
jgi:hypothetical protein